MKNGKSKDLELLQTDVATLSEALYYLSGTEPELDSEMPPRFSKAVFSVMSEYAEHIAEGLEELIQEKFRESKRA